jgi:hypothetical protein
MGPIGSDIYSYSAVLVDIGLTAGTTLWLSIVNDVANSGDTPELLERFVALVREAVQPKRGAPQHVSKQDGPRPRSRQ